MVALPPVGYFRCEKHAALDALREIESEGHRLLADLDTKDLERAGRNWQQRRSDWLDSVSLCMKAVFDQETLRDMLRYFDPSSVPRQIDVVERDDRPASWAEIRSALYGPTKENLEAMRRLIRRAEFCGGPVEPSRANSKMLNTTLASEQRLADSSSRNTSDAMYSAPMGTQIFVSHSSDDVEVAKALVQCFEQSIVIPDGVVRCTSVPGYQLNPGDHFSTTLRENIQSSKIVIGLLSEKSIGSGFVIMELGAAWGLRISTGPVLHPALDFSRIPGPLREHHAVKANSRHGIVELIQTVSRKTGFPERPANKMSAAVDDFLSQTAKNWPIP